MTACLAPALVVLALVVAPRAIHATGHRMPEPSAREPVESRAGDDFIYTWPTRGYGVSFARLRQSFGGLLGELSVVNDRPDPETGERGLISWGSFRVGDRGDLQNLTRVLEERTPLAARDWHRMLTEASVLVHRSFFAGGAWLDLGTHEPAAVRFAIKDLIPIGETSIVYGDGASLKSWSAEAMLVAIALGRPIGPFVPLVQGPVLYLDWETSPDEHHDRVRRICAGVGVDFAALAPGLFTYRQMDHAYVEAAPAVKRGVEERKIVAVVFDSIAWAIGGDVEPKMVIPYMNAVRELGPGVTRLIISHVSKAGAEAAKQGGQAREYGSVFVRNAARSSWEIKRTEAIEDGSRVALALHHRKVNRGKEQPTVYVRVDFDDAVVGQDRHGGDLYGPVTFTRSNLAENPEFVKSAGPGAKVMLALAEARGMTDVDALAKETGMTPSAVRGVLHRYHGKGRVVRLHTPTGGTKWGVAAHEETELSL